MKALAKTALWRTGSYAVAVRVRPWSGVAVLAYHGVRATTQTLLGTSEELHVRLHVLEDHLRALRSLGTPISLSDWRAAQSHGRSLPARPVLVTFDDGYRSLMQHALPLLERYGVPAVAFVCTGPAQTRRLLWYDALDRHHRSAEIEILKQMPYAAWRRLVEACSVEADGADERCVMSPDEIARLAQHSLIEIGAHTVDHPILACASIAVQRQQIADSVRQLQEWTGRPVQAFAYPNGRPGRDFTEDTIAILRELQIPCAFSTEPRIADIDDPMEACPRFTMLDSMSAAELAQNLSVSWPRPV